MPVTVVFFIIAVIGFITLTGWILYQNLKNPYRFQKHPNLMVVVSPEQYEVYRKTGKLPENKEEQAVVDDA
jgi:hypothetical protein